MQPSYFDYYHLTAGKKRLWATQMGSAFWISSVVGGHHNLMLRRQQPGEHPIIDPAQESLLFRRIVAMGRFIRPVDMQQPCGQRSAARRAASVLVSRSVSTSPVAPFTGKSSMCSSRAISPLPTPCRRSRRSSGEMAAVLPEQTVPTEAYIVLSSAVFQRHGTAALSIQRVAAAPQ